MRRCSPLTSYYQQKERENVTPATFWNLGHFLNLTVSLPFHFSSSLVNTFTSSSDKTFASSKQSAKWYIRGALKWRDKGKIKQRRRTFLIVPKTPRHQVIKRSHPSHYHTSLRYERSTTVSSLWRTMVSVMARDTTWLLPCLTPWCLTMAWIRRKWRTFFMLRRHECRQCHHIMRIMACLLQWFLQQNPKSNHLVNNGGRRLRYVHFKPL